MGLGKKLREKKKRGEKRAKKNGKRKENNKTFKIPIFQQNIRPPITFMLHIAL